MASKSKKKKSRRPRCRRYYCRPPKEGSHNVERWTGKRWIPDDGKPGYCFSGQDDRGCPRAWYIECDHMDLSHHAMTCFVAEAMRHTADRYGAANGLPCRVRPKKVK